MLHDPYSSLVFPNGILQLYGEIRKEISLTLTDYLNKQSRLTLSAMWFALMIFLGVVDSATGPQFGLSIFYLIPVARGGMVYQ